METIKSKVNLNNGLSISVNILFSKQTKSQAVKYKAETTFDTIK